VTRELVSPGTARRYPLTLICQMFLVPAGKYARGPAASAPGALAKRDPRTRWSDTAVAAQIRAVPTGSTASLCHRPVTNRVTPKVESV
jgi:hypothetical protein